MKRRAARFAVLASTLMVLAGCVGATDEDAGADEPVDPASTERVALAADKGAIAGIVVDDAFRPLGNALVLMQETGRTARTTANGEFSFTDLKPGAYKLRVDAEGHEASPRDVDVVAGEYAEVTLTARRVVNTDGHIITQEYTVFIPCAADFVVNGIVWNCLLDLSGDSYRAGFVSNYTDMENVTYLVTEMKANQVGSYTVQVREDDGTSRGGVRYAVAEIKDTDYVKIVNRLNETNTEHNEQENNEPWLNDRPFRTILFMIGDHQEEFQSVGLSRGLGAKFGIKARFVQSLFIGEPSVNIDTYRTMS